MFLSLAGRDGAEPTKNFLYARKGPWPQPSPRRPLGTSPEVLHLPWQEKLDWQRHIGLRYLRDLFLYAPISLVKAVRFRELPVIPDPDLSSVLTRGIYSRFLAPLDEVDEEAFAGRYDPDDGGVRFKLDFSPIAGVHPYHGMYVSPTVTLVDAPSGRVEDLAVRAIAIGDQRLVLGPEDGESWDLAKYYVLQGCSYATLFTGHPNVHFPFDTVNAVTKGSLPTDHLLFKVLYPHLRFSLVLDNAVLQSPSSVISNYQSTIYDPFTARASDGLMSFFVAGYKGQPGNSAYPAYHYPTRERGLGLPPTPYGEFLGRYFDPFLEFATAVVDHMTEEELGFAQEWARWIHVWIPGFPDLDFRHADEEVIAESKAKLAHAVAVVLWDVTVVHSTDHHNFAIDIPVDWKCFRLRQAPPVHRNGPAVDRRRLSRKIDLFKSHLAHRMFFAPTTVTHLMAVNYQFGTDELRTVANRLRESLRTVEAGLRQDGVPIFMPLSEMAASIQY